MTNNRYILAIDQGTSSTKTLIFDEQGKAVARGHEILNTHYLDKGFVEQDPEEIFQNVLVSVEKCLADFKNGGGQLSDIYTCGISNQRETFVVWNKQGRALYKAVVWQCKRSVSICNQLKRDGLEETIKAKTGLIVDPYFSATKLMWLNEHVEEVQQAISAGDAYFGTIDCWLLYKLTDGKEYATDFTNASRTLLFNIHNCTWDDELIAAFGLQGINLPQAKPSASSFGCTNINGLLPQPISISAMIGDSHAAAFGEGCFEPGTAKATMGTGCSIMMNVGEKPVLSNNGMVSTICWSTEHTVQYALEGVIVSCGATIEWLKNEMQLFEDSRETEAMANAISDNAGVYLIPAFSGLGSPHWQMERRASLSGMSFGTSRNHIVRAALESIGYQIKDVIAAMEKDAGITLKELNADGGITANKFIVQFVANLLNIKLATIGMPDVSALGAACLAGLKAGIYETIETIRKMSVEKKYHEPFDPDTALRNYQGWLHQIAMYGDA